MGVMKQTEKEKDREHKVEKIIQALMTNTTVKIDWKIKIL